VVPVVRGSRHFPLSSLLCPLCFSLCVSLPSCFFMEMYLCSSLNLTRFPPSPTHTSRAWWRGERRGAASAQTCHPAPCWNCSTVCSEFSCFLFFPLFRCCFSADEFHCDFFFCWSSKCSWGGKRMWWVVPRRAVKGPYQMKKQGPLLAKY
jgi:hypothetical protein